MKPIFADGSKLSVKRCSKLWHVGALELEEKGTRGPSMEGNGLSVSLHPEAWTQIARLGGNPAWELVRPAATFLQFHGLSPTQRAALQQWGINQGYVTMQPQWELRWYDSDADAELMTLLPTEAAALAEQEEQDGTVTEVQVPCPTDAMTQRLGFKTDVLNALDILATFWVEDTTTLDGVWWQDTFDPDNYSAPRGVIVPRALSQWACYRTDDRQQVHRFPDATSVPASEDVSTTPHA